MTTDEDRGLLTQFQAYQQQLQGILIQKENIRLQMLEIDKALKELEASGEKEAYKIAGPVMIKKTITELKKDLGEKKDNFDLRIKTLEKAEERITTKLKEMEPKIKKMIEG